MNKQSFTLVELMVVAIIVAILAAVAIPLMSGNVERAIITEANATLGTIRSNLRALRAEYGGYENIQNDSGSTFTEGDDAVNLPNINEDDLDGHYFSWECYTVETLQDDTDIVESLTDATLTHKAPTFMIKADGSVDATDDVPGAAKVGSGTTDYFAVQMYEDGVTLKSTDGETNWERIQ